MAISRPILLALAGVLLAMVAFYATTGARTSGEEAKEPAAAAPERAPSKARGAKADAAKADGAKAATPASAKARTGAAASTRPGLPAAVARALVSGRTVVLFFYQRGSADDEATAAAVSAVRRRGGAKVFSAPIARLADYRAVTAGVGVTQAPSVVILRKGRGARLVEGFVDPETLVQQVADAR